MSIRKANDQREPAGRTAAGGMGGFSRGLTVEAGKESSRLRESQLARGRIIVKNFGVASPLNCGFQLAPRFLFAEVFVQQIVEKFRRQRAVILGSQRLLHLAKQR